MSMSVLNTFCRVFNYIFVEDGQDNGQAVFCFIDFKNRRARFTAEEISRRVAVGV